MSIQKNETWIKFELFFRLVDIASHSVDKTRKNSNFSIRSETLTFPKNRVEFLNSLICIYQSTTWSFFVLCLHETIECVCFSQVSSNKCLRICPHIPTWNSHRLLHNDRLCYDLWNILNYCLSARRLLNCHSSRCMTKTRQCEIFNER